MKNTLSIVHVGVINFSLVMLSGLQLKSYAVVTIQGSSDPDRKACIMIDPALTNGSNGHFYGDLNQFSIY